MNQIEKVNQMLRIERANQIINNRGKAEMPLHPLVQRALAKYKRQPDNRQLELIAKMLMFDKNKDQVAQILAQELNLSPQQERALQVILERI